MVFRKEYLPHSIIFTNSKKQVILPRDKVYFRNILLVFFEQVAVNNLNW